MRIKWAGIVVPIIASTVVVGGCGEQGRESNAPTATAGTSGAQVEIGDTITYGSFRTTAAIDCGKGKVLNVGGSNNTLTVTGVCTTLNIGGADNKVTLTEVHQTISVLGGNNTVVYRTGNPKIDNLGTGNTISKG
ncbi:Protein of uncharacterised function (DUF3060) [Mycobacteroides abscessus subsp. abscessus]|nr:Protein of uncharacterised function (DUF3060) [Mycobacteroides abscessus subsp. abscessus]